MPSYTSDRRSLLKIFGAIGATCAYPFASDELFAQAAPVPHPPSAPGDETVRFFQDDDFATISKIADLIIPETDTPGAVGAGVPAYIDLVISRNTDQQSVVADGLRWLDEEAQRQGNKKFTELGETQQLAILQPLCDAFDAHNAAARNVQFFALIKSLTADGYYTSKIGLRQELGYTGDTTMAAFPDCVHEH
jgi:hypothetical protein